MVVLVLHSCGPRAVQQIVIGGSPLNTDEIVWVFNEKM